jgi:hypothetical protein
MDNVQVVNSTKKDRPLARLMAAEITGIEDTMPDRKSLMTVPSGGDPRDIDDMWGG